MAALIRQQRVVADTWQRLERATDGSLPAVPQDGDVIVPLALWLERRDALLVRSGRTGVWLDSHEGPEALAGDVGRLALIAVNFPKYQDGRGYSIARLLRERHGYRGELRAIGEVARDHLFYMAGSGFDAFALREGEDVEEALSAFSDFSESYQSSVAHPVPLFRRRLAGGGA
jgi:uncharacterized protein (DUF934 family)